MKQLLADYLKIEPSLIDSWTLRSRNIFLQEERDYDSNNKFYYLEDSDAKPYYEIIFVDEYRPYETINQEELLVFIYNK